MSPSNHQKPVRPSRTIRVPPQAEQSEAALSRKRLRNEMREKQRDLKKRRAQQEGEPWTQVPSQPADPLRSNTLQHLDAHSNIRSHVPHLSSQQDASRRTPDASDPVSTHATVNATIDHTAHDAILQAVQEEERRWDELIDWFKKDRRLRFDTLDLPELEQLFAEQGPGTTLPPNHNPYPNVHIEPRLPVGSSQRATGSQKGKAPVHAAVASQDKYSHMGVNSSFGQPRAQLLSPALSARPLHKSHAQKLHNASQRPVQSPRGPQGHSAWPNPQLSTSSSANNCIVNDTATQAPAPHDRIQALPRHNRTQAPTPHDHIQVATPRDRDAPPIMSHPCPKPSGTSPSQRRQILKVPDRAARAKMKVPDDFTLAMQPLDDDDDPHPGRAVRGIAPHGRRPRRTDWHGRTQRLVDQTAKDTKATLIAAGYMKSAEDRELIIIQAWDRANLSIKDGRQPEPLEPEMIKYVQNLLPPTRKLMKTRLETQVPAEFMLRSGTPEDIRARVKELLPHRFHSLPRSGEHGPLHFEHPYLAEALATIAFRSPTDLGVAFISIFSPITPKLLAFACAMIHNIIKEYETGEHISAATRLEHLRKPYNTYLGSLEQLKIANYPRYCNLLWRLYDQCIERSHAITEPVLEENPDIIPASEFDKSPVERYQPRYHPEEVRAAIQLGGFFDADDSTNINMDIFDEDGQAEGSNDEEGFGQPGPGPSTLLHRIGDKDKEGPGNGYTSEEADNHDSEEGDDGAGDSGEDGDGSEDDFDDA